MTEPRYVRADTGVHAPAEEAVRAFLDPEALRAWWGVEKALVVPRPGGPWALAWGVGAHGLASAAVGVLEKVEPRELLVGSVTFLAADRPFLGHTRIAVRARQRSDKTILSVEESGYGEGPEWDRTYRDALESWPVALLDLKHWVEARFPGWVPD